MWEVLNAQPDLRALLMEVSFPNREQGLAMVSGHHTPRTLAADLANGPARGESFWARGLPRARKMP